MLLKKKYSGKRVFITGHTGFKGSWLLAWLYSLGARVKGYALAPLPDQRLFQSMQGQDLCESVMADILDAGKLEKEITGFEPDVIFHLAAQPLVRYSYEHPLETFNVNAIGTANLLNAVRKLKKPCCVILITTDKVYFNTESEHAYCETDRLGGYDPYSASKAAAEIIIDSYRNSFFNIADIQQHGKSVSVARAGNVIGGGDWSNDRIIPDIIRSLQQKESILVRNPRAIRPWQHVIEPLFGYLLLGAKMMDGPAQYASAFNFGPLVDDCWEVEKLVNKAIEIWGEGQFHTPTNNKAVHEAGILKLDITKAQQQLNWHPLFNAGEAIEKALLWYRSYNGSNALELIQKDIDHYQEQLSEREPS